MNARSWLAAGLAVWCANLASADVVLGNSRFRLVVGDDAKVRSLVVKATGEECAAAAGEIPLFTVTQERPFDDELKLIHPNRRTTFAAKSLTREGDLLKVGFEIVPYVATVAVKETDAYVELKLFGFSTNYYDHCNLRLDKPPAVQFRVVQLPVKDRKNFGNWLNVSWDEQAAIGVVSTSPQPDIDNVRRPGYRILTADLVKGRRFRGGSAAIVVARGREDFLDCMDRLEADFGLPRGVRSRRSGHLNGSIYHGLGTMGPSNIDQHIAWAKKGGFRYMCLPTEVMVKGDGEWGFHGDYDWRDDFPNREADLRALLAKIKSAGIIPGLHFLTPHVGLKSRYVTPVADPRLNVTRRFTLVKPLPADADVRTPFELFVQEPTEDSPRANGIRILKFGGELLSYEDYVTEPPYRFLGVRRGAHRTNVVAHPAGEVGGVLDVSEYGTPTSCYADQNSDLPEEIGAKIANIYNCGFEFAYFDGAEGVNVPCGYHVSNAQYRQYRQFDRVPLFCEGAAKSHFGWHMLSGANAFDCFLPGEFKRMTARFPFGQAPLTWQDMTRCNFGWWFFWAPDAKAKKDLASGTQLDIWEYGQALSFAWDCPTTVLMDERRIAAHPRADDILETMRRWEDARVKQPFTAEEKESLKDASQEHHLYLNEQGGYELVKSEMLPAPEKASSVRGFLFERKGRRVLAFWHESGTEEVEFDFGDGVKREWVANLRYHETALSRAEAKAAYARMKVVQIAVACEARPLTVLTWNTMHYGWDRQTEERKQARTQAMLEALRTSGADIVLIQETYGCYDRFLKGLPGWHGALLGSCNSVYSRYPIVKTYEPYDDGLLYGTTNGYNYGASTKPFTFAVAEIDVEGQRVRVCPIAMNWEPLCISFPKTLTAEEALKWESAPQPNGGRSRPQAMRQILASIADLRAEADEIPIVIGGDFNSQSHLDWTPATASMKEHAGRVIPWEVSRIMADAGFVDTFRQVHPDPAKDYGTTYGWLSLGKPESAIDLRLDYLYSLGWKLKPVSSGCCTKLYLKPYAHNGREYTLFPSDHGFVVTRFELEGTATGS